MKRWITAVLVAATTLAGNVSCDDFLSGSQVSSGTGTLEWHFTPLTKAGEAFPDTNRFLLTVTDAKGNSLYNGTFGASPEKLTVSEGSYTVSARSREFSTPGFDMPVYGDTQTAVVKAGQTTVVSLCCTMVNSGIRLKVGPSFFQAFPAGALTLSSQDGKVDYDYDETRIAYFHPGSVSLLLTEGGTVQTLFARELAAGEILTAGLSGPGNGAASDETLARVEIAVDTAKVWSDYAWSPLAQGAGGSKETALSVPEARASAGMTGVWVYGYIVGGDLSATGDKMNTGPEFAKNTHLAIASRSSVTEKAHCLSVELPKGALRDALNLVDHPERIGQAVWLKGDLAESYFGIPGLKNVKEFDE